MIEVEVPNLGTVEFPDEMSHDDMKGAIEKHFTSNIEAATKFGQSIPGIIGKTMANPAAVAGSEMGQAQGPVVRAENAAQIQRAAATAGGGTVALAPSFTKAAGQALTDAGEAAVASVSDLGSKLTGQSTSDPGVPSNIEAFATGQPLPAEYQSKVLPAVPRAALMATQGVLKNTPRFAGVAVAQALGVPAPVAAAAFFGLTPEGFDAKQAAIAAVLPIVGKYTGAVTEALAGKLRVTKDAALSIVNRLGGATGAAALLTADELNRISKLPENERKDAFIEAVANIAPTTLLGLMGERLKPSEAMRPVRNLAAAALVRPGARPPIEAPAIAGGAPNVQPGRTMVRAPFGMATLEQAQRFTAAGELINRPLEDVRVPQEAPLGEPTYEPSGLGRPTVAPRPEEPAGTVQPPPSPLAPPYNSGQAAQAVREMSAQQQRSGDFEKAVAEKVSQQQAEPLHPDKALTANQLRIVRESLVQAVADGQIPGPNENLLGPQNTLKGDKSVDWKLNQSGNVNVGSFVSQAHEPDANVSKLQLALLDHLTREDVPPIDVQDVSSHESGFQGKYNYDPMSPKDPGRITLSQHARSKTGEVKPIGIKTAVRVINHELIHAKVTNAIDSANFEVRQQLNRLFDIAKQAAKESGFSHNGLKDQSEFISEALSSKRFREFLKKIEYSPKWDESYWKSSPIEQAKGRIRNAFNGFTELIQRILGIPADKWTALEEAIDVSTQLERTRRVAVGGLVSERFSANDLGPEEVRGVIAGSAMEKWAEGIIAQREPLPGEMELGSGLQFDPELGAAWLIKGAAHLERGITDFAKWSAEMLKEFGAAVKPHLKALFEQSKSVRAEKFTQSSLKLSPEGKPTPGAPKSSEPVPVAKMTEEQFAAHMADLKAKGVAAKAKVLKDRLAAGVDPSHVRVTVSPSVAVGDSATKAGVQVDEFHPTLGDTFSDNPETLNAAGFKMPSTEELLKLPQGQYSLPDAINYLKVIAKNKNMPEIVSIGKKGDSTVPDALGMPMGTRYRATAEDYAKWQDISKRRKAAMDAQDWATVDKIAVESEPLKNKYGGGPPEPPKGTPPAAPLGMAESGGDRVHGIAARVSETAAAQGAIAPVEPGQGIGAAESVQHGRQLLAGGTNPQQVIDEFNRTKAVSADGMAVVRAHGEVLRKAAYAAADKFGVNSAEYERAAKADSDWTQAVKPMQTEWHKTGQAQQGETEIDTGTFHGLRAAFIAATGKDFTARQRLAAERIAKANKAINEGVDKAKQEVFTKIAQETSKAPSKPTPIPKPGEVAKPDVKTVWKRAKAMLDAGEDDFDNIRHKLAIDLGIPVAEVTRLLGEPKGARAVTDDMYRRMSQQRRLVSQAKNWLKEQQTPGWLRFTRAVPRVFFIDKVLGHGTVGMITHAGLNIFNPSAWSTYWPNFLRQYKLLGWHDQGAYHERMMQDLVRDPLFTIAKRNGLANDPFRFQDDYQTPAMVKWLGKLGLTGNRGFDSLKLFRQARFNQIWNAAPESLRTPTMAKMVADSVNHATGVVKSSFGGEWANWTFFAPKLEGSRWAWMLGDPWKAAKTFVDWKDASPEARAAAMSEVKQKAAVAGTYFSLLALNQGILSASGSKDKVNFTHPRRSDFLGFKVAGQNVGIVSPMLAMVRLFANLVHASTGSRGKLESVQSRSSEFGSIAGEYARGKLSPFAGFGVDLLSQADFQGRPLPYSSDPVPKYLREQGIKKYTYGEYAAQQFTPIPVSEAIKEVWRSQGMNESEMETYLKALTVGVVAGGTGARLSEVTPAQRR